MFRMLVFPFSGFFSPDYIKKQQNHANVYINKTFIRTVELQKCILKSKTNNSHCIVQQFKNKKQFLTECPNVKSNEHKE